MALKNVMNSLVKGTKHVADAANNPPAGHGPNSGTINRQHVEQAAEDARNQDREYRNQKLGFTGRTQDKPPAVQGWDRANNLYSAMDDETAQKAQDIFLNDKNENLAEYNAEREAMRPDERMLDNVWRYYQDFGIDAYPDNAERARDHSEEENYLSENSSYIPGYQQYRDEQIAAGEEPDSFQAYVDKQKAFEAEQEANAPDVMYADYDEVQLFTDYMNSPEMENWRTRYATGEPDENGVPTFDYYNDYRTLATAGDELSRQAWVGIYTDPTMSNAYLNMLGEEIDTDGVPGISDEEAGQFWDRMNQYAPEELDAFSEDPEMRWIYGYGDVGAANEVVDALNQGYQTNQIRDSLLSGTYAEDVENGYINQIVDAQGNDLVVSLGLDKDAQALLEMEERYDPDDPGSFNQEEYDRVYDRFTANLARYNNAVKATQMSAYYSENPEYNGYLIDFGGYEQPDASYYANGDPYSLDSAVAASQAAGLESLYNNIAGGDAGLHYAYTADAGRDGSVPGAWYDEGSNALYQNRVDSSSRDVDIYDLTGTTAISPDYGYLTLERTGLADYGYSMYTDPHYAQLPEATEGDADDVVYAHGLAPAQRPKGSLVGMTMQSMDPNNEGSWFKKTDLYKNLSNGVGPQHGTADPSQDEPDYSQYVDEWEVLDPSYSANRTYGSR